MTRSIRWLCVLFSVFIIYFHFIASEVTDQTADSVPLRDKDNSKIPVNNLDKSKNEDTTIDPDYKEPGSKTDDRTIEREEEAIKLDGLNVSQMKEMRDKAEKFQFQAEVDRMMKLIINSLYTNKEIFLRELISNGSDALDKIRFLSLTDPSILKDFPELSIKIKIDKLNSIIHITDTGIGMTREDLIQQLGTIANSGTTEFLSKMEQASSHSANLNDFIGQFGVGFYSVFLVSDSVTVISKHNDDDQYIWESDSSNTFTVTKDPRGNTLKRGTEVVLRLKNVAREYLEFENIRRLIRQYSQYISFPIYLWTPKLEQDHDQAPANTDAGKDKDESTEDTSTSVEETKKPNPKDSEPKMKTVWRWELINEQKPIWTRKASEISDQEYSEFYQVLTKSKDEPLTKIHFIAEGEVSFKALLYIPEKAPSNFMDRELKESNIRLYVRRIFITDKILDMVPRFLSFLIGIVDSDDLPLNVSRETLQQEKLMKVIQKKLVRKALDMIRKLPKDKFNKFWEEYRAGVKLGIIDDDTNRNRLTKLLHTRSSASGNETISLSDYVGRMRPQQDEIYFVCADNFEDATESIFAEKYIKKGYEVLFFTEALDEHALHLIGKYDGINLVNLAGADIYFDKTEGAKDKLRRQISEYRPLTEALTKTLAHISEKVESVVLTDRLMSAPMALVPRENGWTGNMEKLAVVQAGNKEEVRMINEHLRLKKNIELNSRHPIIRKLNTLLSSNPNDARTLRILDILFQSTMVASHYRLVDEFHFASTFDSEYVSLFDSFELDDTNFIEKQSSSTQPDDNIGDSNSDEFGEVDQNEQPDPDQLKQDNHEDEASPAKDEL